MVVLLPLGEPDSGLLLEQIAAESARQKASSHPNLGTMFRSRLARRALLAFLDRHPVSVTTADVPGPPHPVYFAGAGVPSISRPRPTPRQQSRWRASRSAPCVQASLTVG